ncbi:hypothetical protein GW17_00052897, partial [Ensete ventricosum]
MALLPWPPTPTGSNRRRMGCAAGSGSFGKLSEAEQDSGGGDHDAEGAHEEAEMHGPAALELAEVAVRRFLVMDLEVAREHGRGVGARGDGRVGGEAHLEELEAIGGEGEGELVAAALVLEAVDAAEGLGDGDVEGEVAEGEEADGGPA